MVFDLDSTLMNVTHRNRRILREFAVAMGLSSSKSLSQKQLLKFTELLVEDHHWGFESAVQQAGIRLSPQLHRKLSLFWSKRFFEGEYLIFDEPYPGAVAYIQRLAKLGVQIVYLSGRDLQNMKLGTVESLRKWGFPVLGKKVRLELKPSSKISDADFKVQYFSGLSGVNPRSSIWFFENEPVILQAVDKAHPGINLVFVDTVHSGEGISPNHLPTVNQGSYF